jgi:hypothetical protein
MAKRTKKKAPPTARPVAITLDECRDIEITDNRVSGDMDFLNATNSEDIHLARNYQAIGKAPNKRGVNWNRKRGVRRS